MTMITAAAAASTTTTHTTTITTKTIIIFNNQLHNKHYCFSSVQFYNDSAKSSQNEIWRSLNVQLFKRGKLNLHFTDNDHIQ